MKKEDINNLIAEGYIKAKKEGIFKSFVENIKMFQSILEEVELDENNRNILINCLACIQTAQETSINTIREVLYKLCCEDDHTEK